MAFIRTIDPADATGLLRRLYDDAVARAGKVFGILRVQSLSPKVLQRSTELYEELMLAPERRLTRAQREAIAPAVSSANDCAY